MKRTIQFESHRNELAAILEMEHEEKLLKLADSQPNRFHFDQVAKIWRCPPGEAYAAQFGLGYIIKSSAGIDWMYQRNILFLEDFLRAETPEISDEIVDYLRSRVAAKPGTALSELLAEATDHGIASDCLYVAIVTDRVYVDLRVAPLAEPAHVRVYFDETSARLHQDTGRHPSPFLPSIPPRPLAGSLLNWDGKVWEIVNQGDSQTWLKDEAGSVISFSEQTLSILLAQGSAQVVAARSAADALEGKSAKELLARASPADLAEANRRYAILTAYRAGGWNQGLGVSARTLRRWEAGMRLAEAVYQCGYAGLLPEKKLSGNRSHRLPEETRKLMEELIDKEYEDARQPTRFAVWSKLHQVCEARSLPAPSYQTFCSYVARRPHYERLKKRQGRRAAYQVKEFFYELSGQTPRHGDRPFEIAHIHPALGQSPREAFLTAQAQSGARLNRAVHPDQEFEMLTLPTTARGSARVMPGRGVRINYIYYWSDAFRDPAVEGGAVPVRYDPYDVSRAYAYVRNHWHQCYGEHYLKFERRTERELMIAAAELRRRHQQHGKRLVVTAHRLASFLSSVEAEELILQQRLRDAEARRSREQTSAGARAPAPATLSQEATRWPSEGLDSKSVRSYDPSELEIYEEY
jgi:hypothetical protein